MFSSTEFRPTVEPTQASYPMGTGALSAEVMRPGCEAVHSRSSSAEIKNGGAIPPLNHTPSWIGAYLIKRRDKFTFTFFL
jgi:hypothetical protein